MTLLHGFGQKHRLELGLNIKFLMKLKKLILQQVYGEERMGITQVCM
jgi:hypothetical protein